MGASRAVLTLDVKVQQLDKELAGAHRGLRDLGVRVQELADRVTRLETLREADRTELGGRVAQFEARVEKRLLAIPESAAPVIPSGKSKPKKK